MMLGVVGAIWITIAGANIFGAAYDKLEEPTTDANTTRGSLTGLERARDQYENGAWKAGLATLKPLLAQSPDDQVLQALRTDLHLLQVNSVGMFSKIRAGKTMRRACAADLERVPDNITALSCLARFYGNAPGIAGGDKDKAWSYLTQLKSLSPAHFHQIAAEMAKDAAERRAAIAQSLAAKPMADVALWSGMLAIAEEDWPRALADIGQALVLEPDHRMARYQLGRAAAMSGMAPEQGVEALVYFLSGPTAFAGDDFRASAHWRLGMILAQHGDKDRARRAFTRALDIDPDHDRAKAALGALPDA